MESPEMLLEASARRAYERGRLQTTLRRSLVLLPVAVLLPLLARDAVVSLVAAGALLVTAFGLLYRGGAPARALPPGLAAGGIAFALPTLPRCATGLCSVPTCAVLCIGGAVTGGFLAGLLLASRVRFMPEDRVLFFWSAVAVALPLGVSGCIVAGGMGLLGFGAGFVAGTGPVLLLARYRS
jgi:hypothetical protein